MRSREPRCSGAGRMPSGDDEGVTKLSPPMMAGDDDVLLFGDGVLVRCSFGKDSFASSANFGPGALLAEAPIRVYTTRAAH